MANPYKIKFYHDENNYGIEIGHEIISAAKEEGIEINFQANNLWEYPENAILNHNVLNGYEYIEALELGIKLAQLGYDSIEVEHIDNKEESKEEIN